MKSYKVLDDINGHQIGSIMGETVVLLVDHQQALAEKDAAYQQLMEKAVRFAECLTDDCSCTPEEVNTSPECAFVRAQVFLKSPEFQAWKERKP